MWRLVLFGNVCSRLFTWFSSTSPKSPKSFGIDVGGFIDAIGYDSQRNVAAYEIKTAGTIPPVPKATHLSQAMTYAILGGIDNVFLVYVGRKVQDFPDPTPLVKVLRWTF